MILPALLDVFNNFDALDKALSILLKTHKIDNQEEVKAATEKITRIRQNLQKNVKQIGSDFQKEVKEYIEALKTDDPKSRIKIQQDAEKKDRKGFSLIFDAVRKVEGDLTTSLIFPVSDAFQNNQSAYDLEDKLREVTPPSLAKDIAGAYDNVSRRISKFSTQYDSLYRKARADDKTQKQDLNRDEKYFRLLYYTMRQAITARAEFTLQTEAKQFEEALQSFVDEQLKRLQICLSEEELSSIALEQAAISDLRKKLAENLPTLPEKFFELPDTIQQKSKTQSEVVGTETYYENVTKTRYESRTEYYTEGSCLKSTKTRTKSVPVNYTDTEQKTRNKYADIEYVELFLPSPKLMAQQWSSGIEKGKDSLWDILCDWITSRLDNVSAIFEESVIDITNLAERALNEQLKIIESNFEEQKQFWASFEAEQNKVTQVRKQLEKESRKIKNNFRSEMLPPQ